MSAVQNYMTDADVRWTMHFIKMLLTSDNDSDAEDHGKLELYLEEHLNFLW